MTRTSGPYKRRAASTGSRKPQTPEPGQDRAAYPGNQSEWAQLGAAHLLLFRARYGK